MDFQPMKKNFAAHDFRVMSATAADADTVGNLYEQNRKALHGGIISPAIWQELLAVKDPNERQLLVFCGDFAVAWLRVSGIENFHTAWLSMLAVHPQAQRQGIGTWAVRYAERIALDAGLCAMRLHTSADNFSARQFYEKCGYCIIHEKKEIYSDDSEQTELCMEKILKAETFFQKGVDSDVTS